MGAGVVSRPAEQRAVSEFLRFSAVDPAALVLTGEAGIGKTTVWLDGLERAREAGFRVLSTRVSAAESVLAYAGLAALLRTVEPRTFAALPPPQRLAMDRVLANVSDDGPMTDQRAVAAGVFAVLQKLAEKSPVLLAIDDVQWLDAPSMHIVSSVARRLHGPIGILAAVRTGPDSVNLGTWLELARPDRMHWMSLRPLSVGALHAVVLERVGRSFSRPKMLQIHQISGGNPFYAVELARAADDGTWDSGASLPGSLAELVKIRIGKLTTDARAALLATASLADPTVELVARATDTTPEALVAALEAAEANGIIGIDGHRLRFTHPLLARGVYSDSGPARRRRMHRRIAELVDEPELRARHLALASAGGDQETLRSLDTAAHMARLRGAPAAAAELLELAVGLGGDTSERRILSAANHFDAGDLVEARRHLQHVIDRLGPSPMRAEAMKLLGLVRISDDSFVEAAGLLERAIDESGDPASRVQMLVMLSYALFNTGSIESALAHTEEAVVSATRLEQPGLVSQALGMRTMFRFLVGDGVDDASLARARELDDRSETVPVPTRPRLQHALLRVWSGHFEEGAAELVAIQKRCAERGEDNDLIFLGFHTALVYVWQGKFGEADQVAVDLMERALQLGGDLPMFVALTIRAMNGAYAGRADEVRRDTAGALAAGERCSSQRLAEWAVTNLGFLEVSLGHYERALATLEPMLAALAAAPKMTEIMSASFVPDAVEAMVAVGRLADAEGLVDILEVNGRRLNRAWMSAVGARGRGVVLAAGGELAAAGEAVARAMECHGQLDMPFEQARTELLLGQLQRRTRRRDAAAATLQKALTTFEELGVPLWAERARTELDRVNARFRRTNGLTASEQRVAELAAAGATNRDMAAALFISPKTVEANLTRIYRKLGVHSRAELGRAMGQLEA